MTTKTVPRRSVAEDLSRILESPEVSRLVDELQATRWTGRPGYPLRAMIGMALAKSLYSLPTWTRTVALVREHPALAAVIAPDGDVPSVYACYRFTAKLREHAPVLERCIAGVIAALKKANPVLGWDVSIDASDLPAYANGQRFVSKGGRERALSEYSDPDASRGGTARLSRRARAAASTATGCTWPCAPRPTFRSRGGSRQRSDHETLSVAPLLDKLHTLGIDPETCALDKGYDNTRVYGDCSERGIAPVIPLRQTPDVKKGRGQAADLRARRVEVRRGRPQAQRDQVALPDRRVQARDACGSRLTVCTR